MSAHTKHTNAVISYTVTIASEDGDTFEVDAQKQVVVPTGPCQDVVPELTECINELGVGESRTFPLPLDNSFSKPFGNIHGVPPRVPVFLHVQVHAVGATEELGAQQLLVGSSEVVEEPPSYSCDELVVIKAEANQLFKQSKFTPAKQRYKDALQGLSRVPVVDKDALEEQAATLKQQIYVPCLLNLAACDLHLCEFEDVVHWCEKALVVDGANIKALYRMAQAQLELGELEACRNTVKLARTVDPTNKAILKTQRELAKAVAEQENASLAFAKKAMHQ